MYARTYVCSAFEKRSPGRQMRPMNAPGDPEPHYRWSGGRLVNLPKKRSYFFSNKLALRRDHFRTDSFQVWGSHVDIGKRHSGISRTFFAIYGTLIFTTYCQPIRLALNRHVSDYNIRVSLRNRSRLISLATDVCRCGLGCESHGFSIVYIVVITDDTCFQPQLTSNRYQ